MNWGIILSFILSAVALAYGIYMIIYLQHAKKCDKYMSKLDQEFRKAAFIITIIEVCLAGLGFLGTILVSLDMGVGIGAKLGRLGAYGGVGSL